LNIFEILSLSLYKVVQLHIPCWVG